MLEIGSSLVQVVLGVFSIYAAHRLRPIRGYAWPMLIGGIAVLTTGLIGLHAIATVGDVNKFIIYRRPLFIVERISAGIVFFTVLVRNLRLAAITNLGRPNE